MLSVSIGDIQKNTKIFSETNEIFQVVDKRKNKVLAMVYPVRKNDITSTLSGKYKNKITKTNLNLSKIKELSLMQNISEKYDLPS